MSTLWKNDDELFAMAKEQLFVALVGDTLPESGKTLSSVRAVLAARLDQATSVDALASSQ